MAKREYIDKQMMLSEYEDILSCQINHPKYENTVREIIEEANEITEQKIVKPYLDKIKGYTDHLRNCGMGKSKSLDFMDKFVDGLLSE